MNPKELEKTLAQVQSGELDIMTAMAKLSAAHGIEDLGFAQIDHARSQRCGFPEFVYGAGKTPEQIVKIVESIRSRDVGVLVTRANTEAAGRVVGAFPEAEYDGIAQTILLRSDKTEKKSGKVVIVSGGTSDLGVATEAKHTVEICGYDVEMVADSGVAGIHRLFAASDRLKSANVIIAVAGMEGALPSVVGGLVSCPVIAVPTSVGYGASLNGLTAMFAMLNSCASGITVVNIDNGFGAACAAVRILQSNTRL